MWRVVDAVIRILQNVKNKPRVADENMFESGEGDTAHGIQTPIFREGRRQTHGGGSLIFSILVQAPISLLSSCASHPQVHGSDGVWVSGSDLSQTSDINHLMVSDSMRYAILM